VARLSKEKYLVLMADDSDDDCLLLKRAVSNAQRLSFIGNVADGDELVGYLNGTGEYADRIRFPMPDLLLLDLKMPRRNGFEVLKWLQAQPFEDMVVVVLSGSDQPEDIERALELGADDYQLKDVDDRKRLELVKALERYFVRGDKG
jgi:CheY-like chemotaxis protein